MKRFRKITPILDREVGSNDAYLAELNSRILMASQTEMQYGAVTSWIN